MSSDLTRNLFWFRPRRFKVIPRPLNLGDALSPFIVEACVRRLAKSEPHPASRRMLALGSVLEKARDGDVVWGTGFNGNKRDSEYRFTTLDVRAVRGPLTAELLRGKGIAVPDRFGDPGILMPLLLERPVPAEKRGPLCIPQIGDPQGAPGGMRVARTVGRDFEAFIDMILASDVVYSGSLHGIILAEAYGVPALFVAHSPTETIHKYRDYYESTGRSAFPVARSFEEARRTSPPSVPNLRTLQQNLLQAFPIELWQ
jgi:pyruvyltransferase